MPSPRFIDALGHGPSDKRIDILRGIASTGSISRAAREAGVSYKAAWQAIDTLTNLAGVPLVERAVGGTGGGGALLTTHGGHLLALADALDAARQTVHARWAAGNVGSDAQADATAARLSVRTSMRNQLPATVATVTRAGRTVQVVMGLGAAPPTDASDRMAARITQESAELLALGPDMRVIALCKATAVRVERADTTSARGTVVNRWVGRVASAWRGVGGDEIVVRLDGGLQIVGFAPGGSGLRVRQAVAVAVDEAAVVVALPG